MGGQDLTLAADLFEEGQWAAARAESLRTKATTTGAEADRAALLAAVSSLRTGHGRDAAQAELLRQWRTDTAPTEIRCMATYEWARTDWSKGGSSNLFNALKFAYLQTHDADLFWRAGCSLYFFMKSESPLQQQDAALWQSLLSCRNVWPPEVWRESRPPQKGGDSIGSLPGRWVVKFYRAQIGPAIGSRCDLLPSCSEYFLQASRAHGLLGIPIMADRFIREPSVVSARAKPVTMPDGHIRFQDPLSDHDAWLKGESP